MFADGEYRETLLIRKNRSPVSALDEAVTDGDRLTITTQIVGG
jgi:sulfur carrier protein ThiS